MASTSRFTSNTEYDDHEDEFEHFDDFTIASSWERFISEIEAVCRQWLADGSKNLLKKGAVCLDIFEDLYKVKSELKYAAKGYCMEYYFKVHNDGNVADWRNSLHDLQLSFGVKEFLVIAPVSASGVVLDAPEASKLLSAVAIALSNCSSLWPAFVPVHDPSREAYIGIQNMGTSVTRRFEADRVGSQVPIKLMHLEGLYELFVSKFAFSTLDLSMHLFDVHFMMRLTYKILTYEDDEVQGNDIDNMESAGDPKTVTHNRTQWDEDCPWSVWYSAEDPVKGFELLALWPEKLVQSSLDMAELENVSPLEAEKWFLFPILSQNLDEPGETNIGFASQLQFLVSSLDASLAAQFIEDFVAVENSGTDNLKSSAIIPPPTVLDRVLKDLFHEDEGAQLSLTQDEHKSSRAIKGAPLESLFAQFCLHALWFGDCNIRAIAVLWIEFVREIRWYWEESQPLPRTQDSGTIDLSTCLINQKVNMLSICIKKKCQQKQEGPNSSKDKEVSSVHVQENFSAPRDVSPSHIVSEAHIREHDRPHSEDQDVAAHTDMRPPEHVRRGSAGVVGSMMLLNSYQYMHAPFTQDPPPMTEDMHEERLQAVEAFGNAFSFSAQLEKEILSSDMSAFKAANPDAVFEDFIRWHSPRDWDSDDNKTTNVSRPNAIDGSKNEWPPRGKLSERMSEHGNSWKKIWNEATPLPASEQKPLFDPNRGGEKVLHYLETLRPHQLLEQMVCTAFRATADTLNRAAFGNLKLMTAKIDQLYATTASSVKILHTKHVDSEIIEDLKRLCATFGHVEKLLILAASLHRKFLQAPRLSEAIFNDYFNFYLPKLGKGSVGGDIKKEFDKKQQVRRHEREAVTSMLVPPTANQSWRKVLSMGNLLNGHEPILREIIFSKRDQLTGSYYVESTARDYQREIETYRMYICGTSNDLRVSLAVASCD